MIRRLLIANRGEIAVRVIRACRELGIGSVAVYSDIDARARHVLAADRAEPIGGAAARDSYLSIPAIIEAARRSGADAVHPGYGFLAENPDLARACEAAGLVFVGPPAEVIARLGSKIAARDVVAAAGVPIVPGVTPDDQSDEGVIDAAGRLGLPVLLKPSAGGGGKGMRLVRNRHDLPAAIQAARREAVASFGDGTLYVERIMEHARHVEFQIFGDAGGRVVHLFERDCSIQRRHQKILEETPSPALTPPLRARMGEAAVAAARAVAYRNAGTIEFLVQGTGDEARFYFLEVNTRLQVEHPITEMVTGVDLVHAQLLVAGGAPLPWSQEQLQQHGHAIECRVYAEDPDADFLPQAGHLSMYREPHGPGIRVDSGVADGDVVSVYYDPLLAKLIAHGEDREVSIRRAAGALRHYTIRGIRTNLVYLARILEHPRFVAGDVDTTFVDEAHAELVRGGEGPVGPGLVTPRGPVGPGFSLVTPGPAADPWTTLEGWRAGMGNAEWGTRNGKARDDERAQPDPAAPRRQRAYPDALTAPMPATVVKILTAPGREVAAGDIVLVLEAMKMELPIRAPRRAIVRAVRCREGELVQAGVALVELEH